MALLGYQRQKKNKCRGEQQNKYRKNKRRKREEKTATWQKYMTTGKERSKTLMCAFAPAVY